jgi:diguanylate cyclase (GGDEF)-like protein
MVQTPRRTVRLLATIGIAVAATVASGATASAGSNADAQAAEVSELADRAAALVAEELALLDDPASSASDLTRVDADGAATLVRLDQLGIDITQAARTTLSRLPAITDGQRPTGPPSVIYTAAIDDLRRIATTPDAVIATSDQGDGGRGDLIAIAMGLAVGLVLILRSPALRDDELDIDGFEFDELDEAMWSDALTGVGNRRRFERDLDAFALPSGGPTALLMVDVDGLREINERHGQQIGDEALFQLAGRLAANVRSQDIVYRYGGEEFCVLLPGATPEDAQVIAERIIEAAHEIDLPDDDRLTVSVGVAAGVVSSLQETFEWADRALLEAKVAGRDQVRSAVLSPSA